MTGFRTPRAIALLVSAAFAQASHAQDSLSGGPLAAAIDETRPRVVKLYGDAAGREHGYGAGIIVSADGKIVTTAAVMLESPSLRAVLSDGRRFPARVLARDDARQLALIQIDAENLAAFALGSSAALEPGDWVIAAGNPFKVADGPEPVSFMRGVFAGRAELAARRRAQDFVYTGPVLLIDVIVSTPGQAGGALVDARGRLVGLIGKAVESTRTNTFVNYAIPVEQVAEFVTAAASGALAGDSGAPGESGAAPRPRPDIGIRVFDVGGPDRPAFVERVRPDSPARRADVRVNDLILSLAGAPIGTCADFAAALAKVAPGQKVELLVQRDDQTLLLELIAGAGP